MHIAILDVKAQTVEINIANLLNKTLKYDETASKKITEISNEYILKIRTNNQFSPELYKKIEDFTKQHNDSYAALSALLLTTSMCFLEETYDKYSQSGVKILDHIINNYPQTVHCKYAIYSKVIIKKEEGNTEDALKLLQENYEVILSMDHDPNYLRMMAELGNPNITEKFASSYFLLLGLLYFDAGNIVESSSIMQKIIKNYPNSNACKDAISIQKAIQKLTN
jgi:outer membrane protein assembly factor BamD (BamD/ComL family)